jgi:hypothetical protein
MPAPVAPILFCLNTEFAPNVIVAGIYAPANG